MNIKETKKPSRRIDVKYLSSLGIQAYDADNLYPQNVAAIGCFVNRYDLLQSIC